MQPTMTLEEIIELFKEIETGKEGQLIGFHLHAGINQAKDLCWETNQNQPPTFSGFLQALRDAPKP
jgi:hypothetical protein